MKLHFHNDPGHGWLEAPEGLLEGLGIAHQISPYSYQGAGVVYLEEDCDAPKLILALKQIGVSPDISESHCNGQSFIRFLPGYVAPPAPAVKPLFSNLAAKCLAQKQSELFDVGGADELALA